MTHSRRAIVAAVLFLLAIPLVAQEPWEGAPFSADPQALLAAAARVPAESDLVLLFQETTYTFDDQGKATSVERHVVRVAGESAVEALATAEATWTPWYYDRPSIEARVVAKDGTVYTLDPSAIVESPAEPVSPEMFSDARELRAPLPGVAVGAVIEVVTRQTSRNLIPDAGISGVFFFGFQIPMNHVRVTLDGPAGFAPRLVNRSGVEPLIAEAGGRKRITFEKRRTAPIENPEWHLPPDELQFPYVAFSTGKSWQDLARRYSEIVDGQIAGSDLKKMVRQAIGNATERKEIVARALAAVQKDIRYAGVETGEGAIIPRPPKFVLQNRYGDCKDKATLLVAMLREAGLSAHVALLRAGHDFDVPADLPGLGTFNHAIVVVDPKKPGQAPLWVDPTDVFAKAGELPSQDQGRMALIAKAETTALTRTPEMSPSENSSSEHRTVTLPEHGRAHLKVVSTSTGPTEASLRRSYATSDRTKYREAMEKYVKAYYFAKSMEKLEASEPRDLTTPFRMSVEAAESRNGTTREGGEADVAVHPANLLADVPYVLLNWDPKKESEEKKRAHDFYWPAPHVREWTFRIVPPAGYVPRTLPPKESRQLGTTTLTVSYEAQPDHSVVATARFDTGKRRLTAAEFEATRVALSKLRTSEQLRIGFEQIGQTKLNAGDIAGALAEFRRLAALHPKEAQHHIELAWALLTGGLADAAREEARRAIALEPTNPRAHKALGNVLQRDRFGRPLRSGFDLAGAIAAFRKAKEVDPKDLDSRLRLARTLTIGEDGERFGRNARIEEAIEELRALRKDLGEEGKGYEIELVAALLEVGRFAEAKEVAEAMEANESGEREIGRITAIAALDGVAAAARELNAFDQSARARYADAVGDTLTQLRLYPEAVKMYELSAQSSTSASQTRAIIERFRKVKRFEEKDLRDGAIGFAQRLVLASAREEKIDGPAFRIQPDPAAYHKNENKPRAELAMARLFQMSGRDDLPRKVAIDMILSLLNFQEEGSDATGHRVRGRLPELGFEEVLNVYLVREGGALKLAGGPEAVHLTGWTVLQFLEAGNLEAARTWLNWAREDLPPPRDEDPITRPALATLWAKNTASATVEQMRVAAASLMMDALTNRSLPILLAAREKASATEASAIDLALAAIHQGRADWASHVKVTERIAAANPDSEAAFQFHTQALSFAGDYAGAEAQAKKRLERHPRDRSALRLLMGNAAAKHDYDAAVRYGEQLVEQSSPTREDYNNVSWFSIFAGRIERAIEHGRAAIAGDYKDPAALHTLATAYAEAGRSLEAREALLGNLDVRGVAEPDSDDWYVLGRIAESYGAMDIALDAYGRVKKDEKRPTGGGTHELAERRLAMLKTKRK